MTHYDARTLYASNSTWQAAAVSPFKNFSVYLLQRQGGCGARHRLSSAAGREGGVAPCVEAFAVNDFQIRTFFLLSRVVHGCGENRRTPCSSSTNSVQHTPSEAAARFELPRAAMPRLPFTARAAMPRLPFTARARCRGAAAAMTGRTPRLRCCQAAVLERSQIEPGSVLKIFYRRIAGKTVCLFFQHGV